MSKYWRERQKKLIEALEKDEKKIAKKLDDYYKAEGAKIKDKIGAYYAKYGNANVIEFRTLLQDLEEADKELLWQDWEAFVKKYPEYTHLAPTRMTVYKLNRLEGLQESIKVQAANNAAVETELARKHLEKWAGEAYGVALGSSFNGINNNVLKAIINDKWVNDADFSTRIWNSKEKISNYLVNDFKNGIIRGDSYDKLTKQLVDRFGVNRSDAKRLIYTEGTHVINESTIRAFEGKYEQYAYAAIGDSRTCSICSALNGQVFDIKDRQPGVNFPPMHANCRCAYTIVTNELTDDELSAINRYVSSESYILNDGLRKGEKMTDALEELKSNLDRAIVKLPKYNEEVYRSLSLSMMGDVEGFNKEHQPGKTVIYTAFTSTGTSVYDEDMDIQLIIKCKNGADLRTFNPNEQEILFGRESSFFVTERKGNTIWMEEM